jgi:hypothetical protein
MGIGTFNTQGDKLAVAGNIIAEEVKLKLIGQWSYCVFEKQYPIASLSEIQKYIQQNKHLPKVPSANEMAEKGINLSEMNMLLLKKVEELTLYLIKINSNNEALNKRLRKLK